MNLEWILVAFEVETVVAVDAVEFVLVQERSAVGVWEGAHELHGVLVLRNVGVVDEVRCGADSHGEVVLEFELGGGADIREGIATPLLDVDASLQVWSWEG